MGDTEPTIDLTGTSYDPLETELTQFLGLKVFLVHGWSDAGAFNQAEANLTFARTPEAYEEARKEYFKAKEDMLASLRANIAMRDPFIGAEISDKELFALQQQGHITLRKSNAELEQAVIVFDPASTPATPLFSIGVSGKDQTEEAKVFNVVAKAPGSVDDLSYNAAIKWAFTDQFRNWWTRLEDREGRPNVRDLVENFDIGIEDIRRYKALMDVRYALRHQNESNDLTQYSRDEPGFRAFAGLYSEGRSGIHAGYYNRNYNDVLIDAQTERSWGEKGFGLKDETFFEKMKLAGAVMNLVYDNLTPNNTFARMSCKYDVDHEKIETIMRDVQNGLEKKFEKEHPDYWATAAFDDWRFLFPFFREFHEADKSNGPKREYLDTIMAGLQKWFPTLTNAPVPDLDRDKEPPRRLQKKNSAKKSRKPNPGP